MKLKVFQIYLFLVGLFFWNCSSTDHRTFPVNFSQSPASDYNLFLEPKRLNFESTPVTLEIIPEDQNGGYTLLWEDTLCSEFMKDERYLEKRPIELFVYILSQKKDTLGQYTGLSFPKQWTYFQTTSPQDSILELQFELGINHFSTYLNEQDSSYIEKFNTQFQHKMNFHPIQLNINQALRQKHTIRLININLKP